MADEHLDWAKADAYFANQRVATNGVIADGVSPENARSAFVNAPQVGLPPEVVMDDPTPVNDMVVSRRDSAILSSAPKTREWVARSPVNAAAARGDVERLAKVEATAGKLLNRKLTEAEIEADPRVQRNKALKNMGFVEGLSDIGGRIAYAFKQSEAAYNAAILAKKKAAAQGDIGGVVKGFFDQGAAAFGGIFSPIAPVAQDAESQFYEQQLRSGATQQQAHDVAFTLVNDYLMGDGLPHPTTLGAKAAKGASEVGPEVDLGGPKPAPKPPHFDPEGGFKVDPNGHVTDAEGNVVSFGSAKEAALWSLREGQAKSPTGQMFEPAVHPTEPGTFAVKETMRRPTEEQFAAEPGDNIVGDALHAKEAEHNAEVLEEMETAVTESAQHSTPEVMADFLKTVSNQVVHIPQKALQDLYMNARKYPEPGDGLLGDIPGLIEDWHTLDGSGRDVAISLADYLAHVSGKPFAAELRPFVRVHEDGMSVAEAEQQKALYEAGVVGREVPVVSGTETHPVTLQDWLATHPVYRTHGDKIPPPENLETGQLIENPGIAEWEKWLGPHPNPPTGVVTPKAKAEFPWDDGGDWEPEEAEFLAEHAPAMKAAAEKISKQIFLNQLFENGKALGLTKPMFERYSKKLEVAQKTIYKAMLERAREQIRKMRSKEWRDTYSKNLTNELDRLASSPAVKASSILREDVVAEMKQLLDTKLVDANGNPLVFYRGQHEPLPDGEHFRPKHFEGISLAENKNFASNWAGDMKYGSQPVVYITHVISKHPGDYRNPDHVERMYAAIVQTHESPEKVGPSPGYPSWTEVKNALARGAWQAWEIPKAFKKAGFDSVRMREGLQAGVPNLFVPHGDQVVFRYTDAILEKMGLKFDPEDLKLYPEALRAGVARNMIASGKPTMSAKPFVYNAPSIGDLASLSKVGEKHIGSNPGGFYADSEGNTWLVKGNRRKVDGHSSEAESAERARNEMLASELINAADPGAAAEVRLVELGDEYGGGMGVASKMIDGARAFDASNPADIAAAREQYALQAWLGNRDAMGLTFDNMLIKDGRAIAIDTGGAMRFRAQGTKKLFENDPIEWDTLRELSYNAEGARVFGGMTPEQLKESATFLQRMPDSKIRAIVKGSGIPEADALASVLIARRNTILTKVGLELPKENMVSGLGMKVDDVAEALGYTSGEALLQDLADLKSAQAKGESFKQQIFRMAKEQAEAATHAELGNLLDPAELDRAAQDAVTSPEVEDLFHEEMKVLAEALGKTPLTKSEIRAHAEMKFGALSVREAVRVKEFMRSLSQRGRDAEAALLKDNSGKGLIEAFKARQEQAILQQMLKLSLAFRDMYRKADKRMVSLARATEVANLPNYYLDQIHGVLKSIGYNLARSDENLAQELTTSLKEFVRAKTAEGADIYAYVNYPRKPTGDHTVDQFTGVSEMIKSLVRAGRNEGETLARDVRMKVEDVIARTVESVNQFDTTITREQREHPNLVEGIDASRRAMDAWLLRWERFILDLTQGDATHPLNLVTAVAYHERLGWLDDQRVALAKDFRALKLGKPFNKWLDKKVEIPDIVDGNGDRRLVRNRDLLGAFLHWGSEDSAMKLAEGFGTTPERMQEIFDEHITEEAAKFAQAVWAFYEKHWPEVVRQYRARGGVVPTKVQGRTITMPWGEIEGGYNPLRYDLAAVDKAEAKELEFDDFLGKSGYGRALPSNGYTHERTDFVGALDVDLNLVRSHMERMLHDLAFRDFIMDAHKVMLDPRVLNAIERKYGPEYVGKGGGRIKQWLDDIATFQSRDMRDAAIVHKFLNGVNRNVMINLIGYSLKTVMKHGPSALSNSLAEVGPLRLAQAAMDTLRNPAKEIKLVYNNSPEVRHRMYSAAEGTREVMQELLEKQGKLAWVQRHAMVLVALSDQFSAVPTWQAAVREISEQHPTLPMADVHALADQRVRQAHGSSNSFDRPDAFRYTQNSMGEMWKMLTRFGTFFNHMLNQIRTIPTDVVKGTKKFKAGDIGGGAKDYGQVIANTMFYLIIPMMVEEWVEGAWDKTHGFIENFVHGEAKFMVSLFPGMRDIWYEVEHIAHSGHGKANIGLSGGIFDLINSAVDVGMDVAHLADGKEAKRLPEDVTHIIGNTFGLPGYAAGRPLQYAWDIAKGGEGSKLNFFDHLRGVAFGENKELKEKLGVSGGKHTVGGGGGHRYVR